MQIKDILVDMTSPSAQASALDAAITLARRNKANVTGLFAYDVSAAIMEMSGYMEARTIEVIMKGAEEAALAKAERIKSIFDAALERGGIKGEWRQTEGNVDSVFEHHARCADLTVFARSHDDDFEVGLAETVLFGSGRPILVVPPVMQQPLSTDRIMIGWNGGREAARAVSDALPLLRDAKAVDLISIASAQDMKARELSAQNLVRHLACHGVSARAKTVTAAGVAPEDLLLNAASDSGASLLVVGGYGHGRFREFVLGGVTRSLMRHATLPVMLSH